jgi:hypothetical protein
VAGGPLVLGATPNDLLKLCSKLGPAGFAPLDLLIVDEASMLPFSALLAVVLGALRPGGRLVLAGDHRQLAAITKYDFEADLRPTVVMHGAHASAYDYVHALGAAGERLGLDVIDS